MSEVLESVNAFVWGLPALIAILGVGSYLTLSTGFAQFRLFPHALRLFKRSLVSRKESAGEVSPYRALCTALAATVGTGNLAGVAGAIAIGGPGTIFWMWVCAILGMITKLAEASLAIHYREKNGYDEFVGGPMYMIRKGMGSRWNYLAVLYCFFGVTASLGVGNATQINAVIGGINSVVLSFGGESSYLLNIIIGVVLAILIAVMLVGGVKRIGNAAEKLVPFAAVGYILLCFVALLLRWRYLPGAFRVIVQGAFDPGAVTGGMLGSSFIALRVGAARGVFTNEAGMGTASIAHAAAKVSHPVEQGLMGIIEVFADTIVICTLTALVILCSGVTIPYGIDTGIRLTQDAFCAILGDWVSIPIAMALCCFAIATVLGWGLYGVRCAQFLFGDRVGKGFAFAQAGTALLGAVLGTGTVWMLAEIVNGLMAIPNLIALAYLTPTLVNLLQTYKEAQPKLGL